MQPISVEGVGGDSEVTIGEDRGDATHHVGFSYIEGLGKVRGIYPWQLCSQALNHPS
jgi:hypothetical protein